MEETDYVGGMISEIIEDMDDVISDMVAYIFHGEDDYEILIDYSDKFSKEFIEKFIESYKLILHDLIKVDKLSEINYISTSDLDFYDSFNQNGHDLKYGSILEAFNDYLSKAPKNILTISDEISYTYEESAYLINQIRLLLEENGLDSEDRVAVFVDRNHWVILSALACISEGITYIPIDGTYPNQRISFMINQSSSKAIIISDSNQLRTEDLIREYDLDLKVINLSSLSDDVGCSSHVDYVEESVNPVACIIYTSGTTGTPKAVQMTNRQIVNFMQFYADTSEFDEISVQGIFVSIGFDISLELFVSVFGGGAVTFVPEDIRLDLNRLNQYYIKHNVTHTFITTQIAKLFVKTISETSLKYLRTGGEKLGSIEPPENYVLTDLYGPAEYNAVSAMDIDKKIYESSVGILNWNTKTYILDNEHRRVPLGAVGEIYVSGYQTTVGYLDNVEANKKVLFENPFDGDIPGYERMYKTGDVARYLPDGTMGIVGRLDSQVKIRGNRVELSEVEITIRGFDYVEDVTVQTMVHDGNKELVAYVVMSSDFEGNISDYIQDNVNERKPTYMVPSFVVTLDKIPLTVNGKVDKRSLPEVDMDSFRVGYVAPSTEDERKIVKKKKKVFNQEKIGIYDDFLRLGGDSLIAIKLLSYIGDNNLTAADLLSLHTPHAIASNINKANNEFDLNKYTLESGCPLNESQLNVYLDIIAHNKIDSYLLPLLMEISNEYSIDEIFQAIEIVLDSHPILSMCISETEDGPYLVKGSKPQISVESNANSEFIREFLTKPFDLDNSLSRFLIVENGNVFNGDGSALDDAGSATNNIGSDYKLFAVFHHIIFDALSENVFKADLLDALKGKSIDLDDSFLKVAAFNQQMETSDEYIGAKDFYESMLVDSEEAGVLLDSVISEGPGTNHIDLDLDVDLFKSFLTDNGLSANVVFTGVFVYALSRFVGSDKVLFNIVENGRDRFNNFNSIGMFVNTLPLLVDCKNSTVSSFLDNMSTLFYDVVKYNFYPFRLLANEYDIDSNIIFQFLPEWVKDYGFSDDFNSADLEDALIDGMNDFNSADLEDALIDDMDDLISDLLVEVIVNDDKYSLYVMHSDRYSKDFIKSFMESNKLILHEMMDVSHLAQINYTPDEDIILLDSYNKTEHELDYDDVLDAFNDNLSRYPDNKIVSMDDRIYSYAEGAFIADKIAESLTDLGVGFDDCVGFLTERSELYVFSILAIMSMGAVYVPLDNNLPDERIDFILNDTDSKVLIVSDETYSRAKDLDNEVTLLNISPLINGDIGTLSSLQVSYGDLACILYTSGTTGIPKGVKIRRKSLINLVEFYQNEYHFTRDDVYGLFSAIGFDVTNFIINCVIAAGASLAIVGEDIRFNMLEMNDYFKRHGVTHSFITTQIGKLFVETIDESSLDVLIIGGEKLGEFESPNDYLLVDAYGPTEAFTFNTSIKNSDKIDFSSVGYLNYNTKAYILDNECRRVPTGAVGELYISGSQLSDGYLNRLEESQKAFKANPFSQSQDYSTIYSTGDMARFLPDGSIGIVGRRDSQVKVRGNRVELLEIEAVIRDMDIIDNVTVQTIKNGENNELVAYIVSSADISDEELESAVCDNVSESKPDYMVPSFVIRLDDIPVNVNGKVDKNALPSVDLHNCKISIALHQMILKRQL